MPNMQKILNEEIRRLARKEIKAALAPLAKQNKALKEQLAAQAKLVKELSKAVAAVPAPAKPEAKPAAAPAGKPEGKKAAKRAFRPAALVAFRKKFSLSQRAVAQLLSTSLVSVTNWENGHAVPRPKMLEQINALRKLGKRELLKRLPAGAKATRRKPRAAKPAAPAPAPAPAPEAPAPAPQA